MRRRLCFSVIGLSVLGVLGSLAGCGRGASYLWAERESWRHDAEVNCLKSGAIKESAALVRVNPIDGPGICGADFPIKVAALGESFSALGFADEIVRPPGSVPRVTGSAQPRWPVSQPPQPPAGIYRPAPIVSEPMAPVYNAPARPSDAYVPPASSGNYLRAPGQPRFAAPVPQRPAPTIAPGEPLPLNAPGLVDLIEADAVRSYPPDRPNNSVINSYPPDRSVVRSYPADRPADTPPPAPYRQQPAAAPASLPLPALGPSRAPLVTGSVRPVEVKPNATLACPIVSALDQWIVQAVQPSALRWFGEPVAEIRQISAYSCRGMNGQVGAKISEHAFGNALDISAFTLASGRKVVVRTAWNGAPEEQGFLRDIQGAACNQFTTVLAPGSNRFHYDHIHVDLMRRSSRRNICQPAAMPGEVAAAKAAQQKGYARRGADPATTGSIRKPKLADEPYEDDDHQYLELGEHTGSVARAAQAKPFRVGRTRD